MISRLQKKYALSDQGAKDLLKAIIYSVLANISLMLPVALLAVVLNAMLPVVLGTEEKITGIAGDTIVGILILIIIFILHYFQYTKAYIGTYEESEKRRITLAEKLRTLPLSFFHERDLADLTSTIMGDCASFEHGIFPHRSSVLWSTDFNCNCVYRAFDHELENGTCTFVGRTGGICNCFVLTQAAREAWKEIYGRKIESVRRNSGMSGNRARY